MSSTKNRAGGAQSTSIPSQRATMSVRGHRVSRRNIALLALAALAAATALALVMALDGGSSGSRDAVAPSSAVRPDGGPDESRTAAAVGGATSSGAALRPDGGPDESRTAAAIARP